MQLKKLEINGFKSFAKKSEFIFDAPIVSIVGPNGSGKSNVVEAIKFALGEQSIKSLRGRLGADLIFKGSKQIPKMNRASSVITFDNSKRKFNLYSENNEKINLDFDEIIISREVFSDGVSVYKINDSEVRARDIQELLASINIGSSGYHIISQGEADRYLNASPKECKEMIEEALGLKIYHYRIRKTERKLRRSKNNLKESESLRRELVPHLRFLKKQAKQFEESKELQKELENKFNIYFKKEQLLIQKEEKEIFENIKFLSEKKIKFKKLLKEKRDGIERLVKIEDNQKIFELEKKLDYIIKNKDENSRQLGRIEGIIDMLEIQNKKKEINNENKITSISFFKVEDLGKKILADIENILSKTENNKEIFIILEKIKRTISNFLKIDEVGKKVNKENIELEIKIRKLRKNKNDLLDNIKKINEVENNIKKEIQNLREKLNIEQKDLRELEKELFNLKVEYREIFSKLEIIEKDNDQISYHKISFTEEMNEAIVLIGKTSINYEKLEIEKKGFDRISQERDRREIERMKIRLESIGGGGGDSVLKEFNETKERDEFLSKEIKDLNNSIKSLQRIISELKEKLEIEFISGLKQINDQFNNFFSLMFGGGNSKLEIITIQKRKKVYEEGISTFKDTNARSTIMSDGGEEFNGDEEIERKEIGINIKVSLPRKRVSNLEMLSGGERSLTSIALLFALSQVNPPPFLVLDETDAALDEVNSRKYGDMLKELSKFSQLILVTHNRETMSRSDVLYGIVLGSDDSSQLISVKLEEAIKIAK